METVGKKLTAILYHQYEAKLLRSEYFHKIWDTLYYRIGNLIGLNFQHEVRGRYRSLYETNR